MQYLDEPVRAPRRALTRHLLLGTLVAVLAGAAASHPAPVLGAAPVRLTAAVGPGFTISIKKNKRSFSSLKAGNYVIVVTDKATNHNFRLTGPGVNRATSVRFMGKKSWRVKLKPGTYNFVCDPHRGSMRGRFTVKR